MPHYGPPEALEIKDIPEPKAGPGEVVVEVAAAALNFFDTLVIAGKYQVKPEFPFSPAAEFAGTVVALGEGVKGFQPGEQVAGNMGFGAAREKVAAPAAQLIHVPEGLALEKAAGLFVTYGTTMHALKDRAKLKAGETLAVLGATGGVGLAAVELGRHMGARVIACASSAEKLEFARAHGAAEVDRLFEGGPEGAAARADRRQGRRRHLRSGRRRLCGERHCALSPGKDGFS